MRYIYILEAFHALDPFKIRFLKEKATILNGDAYDKSRGSQLTEPSCLQRVPRGVN